MKVATLLIVTLFLAVFSFAQASKPGLNGDSFTGTFEKGDDKTSDITLSADVNGQIQTFTGKLSKIKITLPDGSKKELKPSDFPPKANLTVKFKKKEAEQGKPEYNQITNVEMNP